MFRFGGRFVFSVISAENSRWLSRGFQNKAEITTPFEPGYSYIGQILGFRAETDSRRNALPRYTLQQTEGRRE
jgi:hypothetical protein